MKKEEMAEQSEIISDFSVCSVISSSSDDHKIHYCQEN
jgi:hypothetical protein